MYRPVRWGGLSPPPVRVRRNAPVIDTPTARRHTQVPPYIPARTADMARRAGPMCPAAGTGSRNAPVIDTPTARTALRGLRDAFGIVHRAIRPPSATR